VNIVNTSDACVHMIEALRKELPRSITYVLAEVNHYWSKYNGTYFSIEIHLILHGLTIFLIGYFSRDLLFLLFFNDNTKDTILNWEKCQ